MDRFKALGVSDDIINLIAKPPLLQSESKQEYFDLLAALFEDYGATQRVEYLALTQYANQYWRIRSLELARASIIGHWEPKARIALIKDYAPEAYMNFDERLREQYPNGIDSHLLTGRATILANNKNHLQYLDSEIEWRSRECEKISHSLAFWRALMPHRSRRNPNTRRK